MNKKMKVLMVEHFGGENIYSYCLCNALCRLNIDLTLITTTSFINATDKYKVLRFYPAYEKRSKAGKVFQYFSALIRTLNLIIAERFDIIHFQTFRKAGCEWIIFKFISFICRNTVFTCHNIYPHENTRWKTFIFKQVYKSAGKIIVHNNYASRFLESVLNGKNKEKISIIPHGSYEYYLKIAKQCEDSEIIISQSGSNELSLMMFGVMREYKGLDILLKAMSNVQNMPVKLFVCGRAGEEYRVKHERLVKELGIKNKVTFHWGEVPNENVASVISPMDILVFPYRNIYQSGALMLAYTLSKAVMVSPAEGFREDVIHGKNGFITDFNNGEEFRNIILYLISNKEKLKDIGNYNRMRADTKHGWDGIAVETEKTYKRVMS